MKKLSAQKKHQQHQRLLKKAKQDPATLYLNSLAPSGRRPVRSLLTSAIGRLGFDETPEEMPWHMLEYQHLVKIRTMMLEEEKAISSINLTLSGLKGVLGACFDLELLSAEELMRVKKVKPARGKSMPKGRSLTDVEITRLIKIASKDKTVCGKRDYAIIGLMIATGMRRSEVVQLNREDYDAKSGELKILKGKGSKDRKLFLPATVRAKLKPWLSVRGHEGGTFFNQTKAGEILEMRMSDYEIYKVVVRAANNAAVDRFSPHDLRRTFITKLLDGGVDINSVRQLAGHAGIQTTALYDRRGDRQQRSAMKFMGDLM